MPTTYHKTEIKPIFAWYDFWIGLFWDSKKRRLYVFPVPMFGFFVQLKPVVHCLCPECHGDKTLAVTVDYSQEGTHPEYGQVFSFDGTGRCNHCGWKGDVSDSSI